MLERQVFSFFFFPLFCFRGGASKPQTLTVDYFIVFEEVRRGKEKVGAKKREGERVEGGWFG